MDNRPAPAASPFRFRPLRTLRFALIVALGFALLNFALTAAHPSWQTAAGWARAFGTSAVFAVCISLAIDLLFALGSRALGRRYQALAAWQRALFHWGTPLLGLAIGLPLAALLTGAFAAGDVGPGMRTTPLGAVAFMTLVMALFYGFFAIRARQLRAERQAAQAQLRLLQAQMEPHFLFNTLANVVSLMDGDAPRAKAMLESFTDYLRASLGSLRRDAQTLGDELALVEAYLHIVGIRMEGRLQYRIDVPDALRALTLPLLSLQPLVENAVQHGLEPQIAGGTVEIAAHTEAGMLVVSVSDDGPGLGSVVASAQRGTGTALANIRERLAHAFGDAGRLTLESRTPHGVRATLRVPNR